MDPYDTTFELQDEHELRLRVVAWLNERLNEMEKRERFEGDRDSE